ncbi:hypothetical protein HUB98_05880 [Paenibacillus barcinonensis]|uniref:Uncharacterized protein n=1 Tax=Paenibacillus barcinonensis TaxID=198119 RepID=A0A2V4VNW2_PAEBA|nr:hypothetical protein [Paenibacillus barcinonensis]PYE51531.1 hypothetical protein DFQ00_102325 [Paenibacillus barcinonensis]QKS55910.1 hypothetical protein HUB98_05880 [Paenibacillus barcinonensis]
MYKKYWNEDGKRYMVKINDVKVVTDTKGQTTYYKNVQKLKIFEKRKYLIGWKCIYINQWDEDSGIDLKKQVRESIQDCFVGN